MNSIENALPDGYAWKQYKIKKVLFCGNRSIVYLATYKRKTPVIIKEYCPEQYVVREGEALKLVCPDYAEPFTQGLRRFYQEAKLQIACRHPGIVKVYCYLKVNNTLWIIQEYISGYSLGESLSMGETATLEELRLLIPPLLGALKGIHDFGWLHNDIHPGTLWIRDNNRPVLLGVKKESSFLGISPYQPFELYESGMNFRGPWTDIYALAAVLYHSICGELPVEISQRIRAITNGEEDPLIPAARLCGKQYPAGFLKCVDWGMNISEQERPRKIEEWKSCLLEKLSNKRKWYQFW